MARSNLPDRTAVIRAITTYIEDGLQDQEIATRVLRQWPYAMSSVYALIRESHLRLAGLGVQKGTTRLSLRRSQKKGGGENR